MAEAGIEECAICFEALSNDDYVLKCKHRFHKRCLNKWLLRQTTCPMCRERLTPKTKVVSRSIWVWRLCAFIQVDEVHFDN